jgi:hypothetical protein
MRSRPKAPSVATAASPRHETSVPWNDPPGGRAFGEQADFDGRGPPTRKTSILDAAHAYPDSPVSGLSKRCIL